MSGNTPTPGSDPGDEKNPYAQPSDSSFPGGAPWSGGTSPADQPPAWSGPMGEPDPQERPSAPKSIVNAVRLMYVGAGLSALGLLSTLTSTDQVREAVEDADTEGLSGSEVDAAVNMSIGIGIFVGVLGVALWVWMALKNKQGKSWARTVATVLGGLNIAFTLFSIMGSSAGLSMIVNIASIALAAVILWFLYRPESTEYYAAVSRMTR